MIDAIVDMRQGEKRYVYATFTPQSGTITLSGRPTITLKDASGTAVTGCTAANVTGYDATAVASARAWHLIDVTALDLDPGFYLAEITATESGGERLTSVVGVRVLSL